MSRLIELGDVSTLFIALPDRRTDAYARARVYSASGVEVIGSPFALTHVANGIYLSTSWTPGAIGNFIVWYEASLASSFSTQDYNPFTEWVSIVNTRAKIADNYARMGAPVGASISADIASVKADTSGLRSDYTGGRAIKLDNLDATLSSRATQTSVNAIPTNPLLVNDSRLNNLDATISSRSTQTSVNSVPGAVWGAARSSNNGANTFGEALQGVLSVTRASNLDNVDVAVSTRASASNLALIPTNTLLSIDPRLNTLDVAISTRAAASDMPSANMNAAAVWNMSRNAATTVNTFGESLQGVISVDRAAKIDNLDAPVSTRESSSDALSRYNDLVTKIDDADGRAIG